MSDNERLQQALSQCALLSRRSRPRQATGHARLAGALLVKILQRGRTPLPTLNVERQALRTYGFLDAVHDLKAEGAEIGWELRSGVGPRPTPEAVLATLTDRTPFALDPAFRFEPGSDTGLLGSDAETWFLEKWVPEALGRSAGHWFTPQASLDKLLESSGADESGARRIDFLFNHPGGPPLAIEIDGPEHASTAQVDNARDDSLRAIKIDVLRVTNEEVNSGRGVGLDRIRSRCEEVLTAFRSASVDERASLFVIDCAVAAKVQFAIARAIGFGWLTAGQEWEIDLAGAGSVAAAGVLDTLKLLAGFDVLYDGCSVPLRCTVRADDGLTITWFRDADGEWSKAAAPQAQGENVRIAIESRASPLHLTPYEKRADILVRPAYLPVVLATEQTFDFGRKAIAPSTYEDASQALRVFLWHIFRKYQFRPNQGEAIFNALRQKDCVVLLPTGAGKSLIYQLAGLLMPGITLVVDPLVSLIEDQVEGLRTYGIDRAAPIASNLAAPEERKRLLLRVERGEYQFVLHSPERLQSSQFRGALRALAQSSLVNLAVIDEAHCVSDWGHDFRPAYLNLANNLRRLGADRQDLSPPLLALTGTASRAVLRDMLANLGIDRNRSDALIRPGSFDRTELSFEILRTSPTEDPKAALRGILNALPGKFGLPRTEFYRPAGRNTASGIVFVPTVNARVYGVMDTRAAVQSATETEVTIYSGSPPGQIDRALYDAQKRENASAFKRNRVPVLVATKAFGMGIDKPNIRYTVHLGMPSSLENFYQEAGRAGRDRKPARCFVVFSEYSPSRSDELLDPDLDLETLRERFEDVNRDRVTGDDVTRALWFHLQGFSGAEKEINEFNRILDEIGDLSVRRRVVLPFDKGDSGKDKEKAIYRLLRLGVIDDYEVDYGALQFVVHIEIFDLDRCKKCLLEYVHAAQPAKSKLLIRQLDTIDSGRPNAVAVILARILIEFAYDVIERSRRRMIQESILLARQAQHDKEIRARLLDYLQEGLGAERIEQLLGEAEVDMPAWGELVHKIQTPMDAGELRGLCIRALESYPDHPGLLLARAVAESMCSDHDDRTSSQGIGASIRTGVVDYELAQSDIEGVIDELFDLALTRAPGLSLPLTVALFDLCEAGRRFAFASRKGMERAVEFDDPRVRAVIATQKIYGIVDRLGTAVDHVIREYEAPGVEKALTGA